MNKNSFYLFLLDRGGVRGLLILLIFKYFIDRTNAERKIYGLDLVASYKLFDLIGGTSTGG